MSGFLDAALGFVLLAGDALGVDPQQEIHAVARPLGDLRRWHSSVEPRGQRRMAKVIGPRGQNPSRTCSVSMHSRPRARASSRARANTVRAFSSNRSSTDGPSSAWPSRGICPIPEGTRNLFIRRFRGPEEHGWLWPAGQPARGSSWAAAELAQDVPGLQLGVGAYASPSPSNPGCTPPRQITNHAMWRPSRLAA